MKYYYLSSSSVKYSHIRTTFFVCAFLYAVAVSLWYWYKIRDPSSYLLPIGRGVITNKPIILFTGKWWQGEFPYLELANHRCPQCYFTQDQALWDSIYTKALIFHGRMLNPIVPPRQSTKHIWIFMLFEALNLSDDPESWKNIPLYDGLFNWTMTYRRDSDIFVPYGKFIPINSLPRPAFNESWAFIPGAKGALTYQNIHYTETPSVKDFHTKKMAAWIVSRCQAPNGREDLVSQLQSHHISVDIYGPCGNSTCDIPKSQALTGVDCRVQIHTKYKFYLAFENSNCVDYVTEKFFDIVGVTEMIPIVYGGADYSNMFPPKSFINVRDFRSVQQLAEYLIFLAENPEKWLEYFTWRKSYWVQTNRFVSTYCNVCHKILQRNNTVGKVYDKIWQWWLHTGDKEHEKSACY